MIKSNLLSLTCLLLLTGGVLSLIFTGCSTQKQHNDRSGFFLNFSTKYNILYNGNALLEQGQRAIAETTQDNYQQHLSVFKEPTETSIQQNKTLMDSLLDKATRIINEKAESKYIDDAYMLKGKANYYLGNYFTANEFFDYVLKNMSESSRTTQEALIWRANSLIQLGNMHDALAVLDDAFANSEKEDRFNGMLYAVQAKYYLQEKNNDAAIDMLSKAISYSKHKKNKLRWHYLLGQLLFEKGENAAAFPHFTKIVKSNESYEMAFYANLYRIEILNKDKPGIQTRIALLTKLLRDNKNKNYKGQIYQRIGDAYLADGNVDQAVHHYQLAINNSRNNNFQQSINYLTLADLFFEEELYAKASVYYDSTMQILPKDNLHYEPIKRKTANLSALVEQLTTISHQDTLLMLAALDPSKRDIMIDSILEKRLLLTQSSSDSNDQGDLSKNTPFRMDTPPLPGGDNNQSNTFYFSNVAAITQGFSSFKRQWGNRQLVDNWRYSSKAQLDNVSNMADRQPDTIVNKEETAKILKETWRENYMQDIPDTDEELLLANQKIIQAYWQLGEIYQNALFDEIEAANTYETLLKRFPEIDNADLIYYHLYRLYADKQPEKSIFYREKLVNEYPNSKYASVIKDPEYYKTQGDLLQKFNDYYSSVYDLFIDKKYKEVIHSTQSAIQEATYDASGNTAQLAYLQALAIGRSHKIDDFKKALNKIIDLYPKDELVLPLIKQHIAYIDTHPDQFADRNTALEERNEDRQQFVDEPTLTPWPELVFSRQYSIPQQDRKNYTEVDSKMSFASGQHSRKNESLRHKQLEIGSISENRHENSYRNLDLLPSKANYYFVINVMYGSINLSPSRYGIGQFNRGQYPNAPIKHQLKNVAHENQLVYIGVFPSFDEVKAYEDKIKPLLKNIMKIPEDAYNSFIITEDNLNTLTDFDKIDDYHTVYTQEP